MAITAKEINKAVEISKKYGASKIILFDIAYRRNQGNCIRSKTRRTYAHPKNCNCKFYGTVL